MEILIFNLLIHVAVKKLLCPTMYKRNAGQSAKYERLNNFETSVKIESEEH
jgi:hypothetical protein